MTLGPTIIRKCSNCSNLIEQDTLLSGNTFGARIWTDGYMEAPMLPEFPWLVKCPHCNALLWINDQEKIDVVPFFSSKLMEALREHAEGKLHPKRKKKIPYEDAKPVQTPVMDEYFTVLDKGLLNIEKERYIRIHIWRYDNNKRRNADLKIELSESEKQNMSVLEKILDENDDNDRIFKAEIKRESGDFEGALILLEKPFDDKFLKVVRFMKKLIHEHKTDVTEVIFKD